MFGSISGSTPSFPTIPQLKSRGMLALPAPPGLQPQPPPPEMALPQGARGPRRLERKWVQSGCPLRAIRRFSCHSGLLASDITHIKGGRLYTTVLYQCYHSENMNLNSPLCAAKMQKTTRNEHYQKHHTSRYRSTSSSCKGTSIACNKKNRDQLLKASLLIACKQLR